jgi:hypothetical protein
VWRALATALALSFLLAGCGGTKGTTQGGGETTAPRTPAGWTRHHVAGSGFSIDTPERWKGTSGLDKESVDRFLTNNPQFEQLRSSLSNELIKFFAADPKVNDGFATNVNVLVQGIPGNVSLDDYARGTSAELSRETGIHPNLAFVDLPAGHAARFAYALSGLRINGKATDLALLQYALVHDKTAYVLSFTTRPALRQRYRSIFEQAARSFRFD